MPWADGTWRNPPATAVVQGHQLLVTAQAGSDAWRSTSYGFVRDTAHALLGPLPLDSAIEVEFVVDYAAQFDQAGVWLHATNKHWVKAGVEISDGQPQLGAVVTQGLSDWSLAPVPEWQGRRVTVRLSRAGNAVTVRARAEAEPFRMARLVPLDPSTLAWAGPYCASPSRGGLQVRFTGWRTGPTDQALHP